MTLISQIKEIKKKISSQILFDEKISIFQSKNMAGADMAARRPPVEITKFCESEPVILKIIPDGYIYLNYLKKKSAINIKNNSILYKKSTIYSKPIARLATGRLVLIKKCKIEWCKITSGKYSGWIEKNYLWGRIN